jgi:hypothetical protein
MVCVKSVIYQKIELPTNKNMGYNSAPSLARRTLGFARGRMKKRQ